MIDETNYASDVAYELDLASSAYAEDVTGKVSLTSAAYGEDVVEAINEQPSGEYDLRVCQLNIGHFAMGASSQANWTDANDDGYPNSLNRKYSTQLARMERLVDGLGVDIFGMPEYSTIFGTHNNYNVPTRSCGVFDDYDYFSVGATEGGGFWINALISKYALSNSKDFYLGSISGAHAYARVAEMTIKGKIVKMAVTHLNWNQSQLHYNSRQIEIKNLVKLFQNDPYVILCGDFNTRPMNGDEVNGLHDFDPFINGFTEDGVTYKGGFTLANNLTHPLATCYATGSRPDVDDPNYPFVYIDNICTKGFRMSNIRVLDTDVFNTPEDPLHIGMLTDHCAVVADLTLIDNE